MYIIYVNHDSVIKQICQLTGKALLINETLAPVKGKQGQQTHTLALQLGKMHFARAHEEDWSPPAY